ncbi:3-oxoacyl-[acyl-carrier protein] reductase [Novosphingobium hassiacum]|uniref:3-oxoacyl-[acyl-carrier protein] reductase n=1 Tax=Novosphingobium hassiacum TaxID=173676 RepID=A0A7W6EXR5_9SPHN|nr:SDR family oxidoreductase [Novosphingobium hassiacum]MBB3862652.1 3-oxoacyl-[acyl-carrier protein] reductase [Novosphingobium hassiacum]
MNFGIKGKVAVSGGGSKGMGRAVSEDLAREGCRVIVAARGQQAVDEVVAKIRDEGGEATGVYADMSTKEGILKVQAEARTVYGDPEIVVGNVYGPTHGRWDDTQDGHFLDAYESIVMSQVHLLRTFTPAMRERRWGRIVLINSIAAKQPHKELPLVTANVSRVAAVSLNKSVSDEIAKYGITINTIGTGGFATDRYFEHMKRMTLENGLNWDEREAERRDEIPVGRLGRSEEMSAVIAFLCSERASYVTGQFIIVDGGAVQALY